MSLPHLGYFYLLVFIHKLGVPFDRIDRELLTFFQTASFVIVLTAYGHFENRATKSLITIAGLFSVLAGAIYWPWFNENPYFGQGSPNVHHNSTVIASRPFAVASFFLILHGLQPGSRKRLWLTIGSAMLACATFIKPTFAIVFLPSLGVFTLLRCERAKQQLLHVSLVAAPTVAMLLLQYVRFYSGTRLDGTRWTV